MTTVPEHGVPDSDRTAGDGVALVRHGRPDRRVVLHLSDDLRRGLTAGAADVLTARLGDAAPDHS
ncbi:hypothetical protein J2S43_001378 [Catenuloplanes nepalensis]|uniref:Uncharacterized protein n=1 Tax=Catenuloplanes nepalensis TaxID=587533 RepID=A0ABT9MN50_9ACTN|nr:hypothetical protein [Catenuloplanes nepalensis]MDP9792866.1 hypothetical protein [Catenuloplanes nepalensis]